ncbi:exodeoxyribonuclease VII small subunit [Lachnospiraceae bacterium]|nr:exodeoxyribonuclease VII small subunit [Lachnospiraceae bacterium]
MSKEKQEATLEETFQEMDAIIEKMQDREVTLEESFSLYEQGIKKLKYCNEKIDSVEKRMLLLNEQGELEAFDE